MREGSEADRAGLLEALSVFALILLYIWRVRLFHPWRWVWMVAIVVLSHWVRGEGARALGLRWREFRSGLRALSPWVAVIAGLLLVGGWACGTVNPVVWRRAPGSLAVYLAWGLVQQWMLNAYFLNRLAGAGLGRHAPAAATALFTAAHLPNWFLMAVAAVGGSLATRLFLRYRSLWILGLAHGLIGYLLNLVVPDAISGRFLVGPRYILHQYGTYPEALL